MTTEDKLFTPAETSSPGDGEFGAPIFLNLTGRYRMPVRGERQRSGSVTGDLRLASLDAFLASLGNAMEAHAPKGANAERDGTTLAAALSVLIRNCEKTRPLDADLTLVITSKLSPATGELVYSFSVKALPKT